MSDETPDTPGPSAEEPITAAPVEEPTVPTAPSADAAEAPTEAADTPAPAAEAPTQAAEAPTLAADAPAEAAPDPAAVAPAAPAAPVAAAPAAPERGRGVFVPAWVAVVVGVLLVAGLGFLVGWVAAPDDDSSPSNAVATAPNGQQVPTFPGGNGQNLPGNGNGNGNGNDDNGDNGNGSPTVPSFTGGFLGITLESATDGGGGARVNSVQADSPAAKAGLKEGDIITAIDGDDVTSALDVVRAVRTTDPGDSITVTYTRNGNSNQAKVTLGERPTTAS